MTAVLVAHAFRNAPSYGYGDFWRPWAGAQAMLQGTSPYSWFAPGGKFAPEYGDLYPLSASVILLPLTVFPFNVAAGIFSGVSASLLAWAVSRENFQRLPIFMAFPVIVALHSSQMAVIQSAAFVMPGLAFLYSQKPTIGLALLLAQWSRKAIAVSAFGFLLTLAISVMIAPAWPFEWMETVRVHSGHMTPPIMEKGGFVALLALLRWRRPEARLIVLLSLIPQVTAWYDSVPLLLVPNTMMQSLISAITVSLPPMWEIMTFGGSDGFHDFYPKGYQLALFAYLPPVIMVLRRPNECDKNPAPG